MRRDEKRREEKRGGEKRWEETRRDEKRRVSIYVCNYIFLLDTLSSSISLPFSISLSLSIDPSLSQYVSYFFSLHLYLYLLLTMYYSLHLSHLINLSTTFSHFSYSNTIIQYIALYCSIPSHSITLCISLIVSISFSSWATLYSQWKFTNKNRKRGWP